MQCSSNGDVDCRSEQQRSDSGPSISSSSSDPAVVDSSGNEPEDSLEPVQEVDVRVVSLLRRLKSPRPSNFAQKRNIAANPPCGKRRSRGTVDTELKTVKPEKRVKEHTNRPLTNTAETGNEPSP